MNWMWRRLKARARSKRRRKRAELLKALDVAADEARSALEKTSDEHLMTNWKLLADGQVV